MASACSEYELTPEEKAGGGLDTAQEQPDILVTPLEIAITGVCGSSDSQIQISNRGDANLEVTDLSIIGTGWTVEDVGLPELLPPDTTTSLLVTGGEGEAVLRIDSNDPDSPTVTVSLSAEADQAPEVAITSPADTSTLPVGVDVTLGALVTDPETSPEALLLTWTSDVDGTIGSANADTHGTASATWGDGRSDGDHTVSLSVTDSCSNTTEAEITVCQQAGYTSDALDIASWHFEGGATWDSDDDWLQLTEPTEYQTGSAFATSSTVSGDAVEIEFNFYIGGGTGADGISLTALNVDEMSSYLGGSGCGIGYAGGGGCTAGPALPGWSIEVDTYYNSEVDPTEEDHVAFTFDGQVTSYAAWSALPEMEDTGWHTMSVTVAAPHVTVTIDGITYIDNDLSGDFSFPAYVGFTAGTGGLTNYHLIDSLVVSEYACEE
jgi:hypothetical protein